MAKKQKLGTTITAVLILAGIVLGSFVQVWPAHAEPTQYSLCYQQGGVWDDVYGCRKASRLQAEVPETVCLGHLHGRISADGRCTYFTYTYLWGGNGGNTAGGSQPTKIQKLVDNASDCNGTIKNRDSVTGKFVCEEDVSAEEGGGGGGDWYGPDANTGDYSRPEHPGREPTENENNDPGGSEMTTDSGIDAVPGNGYSSTGGVKTELEVVEPAVLDCSGKDGIFCILNTALTVLTWGVGIAATVGLVLSGIQYASARDSAEQAAKAMKRIIGIVIGLLVYAMMWGFLNWLLPGGLF